jgi:hypothetical protein
MNLSSDRCAILFVKTFFHLFNAELESIRITDKIIRGFVKWEGEDEEQEISWDIPNDICKFNDVINLIEYIFGQNILKGDMVVIDRSRLESQLKMIGWDAAKINNAIDRLFSLRIPMIDKEQVVDYFFIHF